MMQDMHSTTEDVNTMLLAQKELEQLQNENNILLGQTEEQQNHIKRLLEENDYYRKKIASQQLELQSAQSDTDRMEKRLYEREEKLELMELEVKSAQRQLRELEKQSKKEAEFFESERAAWAEKETKFEEQLALLQRQLSKLQAEQSDKVEQAAQQDKAREAEKAYEEHRALMIAQKTISEQDKLILKLRGEIEQGKTEFDEVYEQCQEQSLRIAHLEMQIEQLKGINESLQQDNESYQILLQEKTVNGEFSLHGIIDSDILQLPPTPSPGCDLATELTRATSAPSSPGLRAITDLQREVQLEEELTKLRNEVKTLKDENKALALYINKILTRIMEHKQLENILARDYDSLPKAPPVPQRRSSLAPPPTQLTVNTTKTEGARSLSKFRFGRRASTSATPAPKPAAPTPPKGPSAGNGTKPPSAAETRLQVRKWRRHQSLSIPRSKMLEEISEADPAAERKAAAGTNANKPAILTPTPSIITTESISEETSTQSSVQTPPSPAEETAPDDKPVSGFRRALRRMSLLGNWKATPTKETDDRSTAQSTTASSTRSISDSIPEEEE